MNGCKKMIYKTLEPTSPPHLSAPSLSQEYTNHKVCLHKHALKVHKQWQELRFGPPIKTAVPNSGTARFTADADIMERTAIMKHGGGAKVMLASSHQQDLI